MSEGGGCASGVRLLSHACAPSHTRFSYATGTGSGSLRAFELQLSSSVAASSRRFSSVRVHGPSSRHSFVAFPLSISLCSHLSRTLQQPRSRRLCYRCRSRESELLLLLLCAWNLSSGSWLLIQRLLFAPASSTVRLSWVPTHKHICVCTLCVSACVCVRLCVCVPTILCIIFCARAQSKQS